MSDPFAPPLQPIHVYPCTIESGLISKTLFKNNKLVISMTLAQQSPPMSTSAHLVLPSGPLLSPVPSGKLLATFHIRIDMRGGISGVVNGYRNEMRARFTDDVASFFCTYHAHDHKLRIFIKLSRVSAPKMLHTLNK